MSAGRRGRAANGVTRQEVLDYLIRDADLDGLVTTTTVEVGKALGVAQSAAQTHFARLVESGAMTPVKRGQHGVVTYLLADA